MSEEPQPIDRRAAMKARSRPAILDAAADLIQQRRNTNFSVDELANAADVSRRTVFNHFATLDDVVTAVAGELLVEVIDRMEAWAVAESREVGTVLNDLAATASGDRLVPTVAYLFEILGSKDPHDSVRGAVLMQRAISMFTEQMSGTIARLHPEADLLKVELLVSAFTGGLLGIVDRWAAATGAVDTPQSHQLWDEFVSALISVLRAP